MARYTFRDPSQPPWLQGILRLFEAFASLKLAVVLIFSCAFVLAWATFVESAYGTQAVQFGLYGAWWFGLLNALLALNIFCAAAIRYPWKRYQTGFVITHIGLLTLLFGCLLSRRGGIDAQLPIFEGHKESRAFEESYHLELTASGITGSAGRGTGERLEIPPITFQCGPFNWSDYDSELRVVPWLPAIPWNLASRNHRGDVLYEGEGIRLEVLDFYSDSRQVSAPAVTLRMSAPKMPGQEGSDEETAWIPVNLNVIAPDDLAFPGYPNGLSKREKMGGGSIGFWLVSSQPQLDAFLKCVPAGELGEKGQVVLWYRGKPLSILLDDYWEQGRKPLEGTDLEVEIAQWFESAGISVAGGKPALVSGEQGLKMGPGVEIKLFSPSVGETSLILFADEPIFDVPDYAKELFATYWYDHGEKTASQLLQGAGGSRLDIVQGPDQKLYYRYWNRKQVVLAQTLPTDGTPVDAFRMPIGQLMMYVEEFVASDKPAKKTLPVAFDGKKPFGLKRAAGNFRLTLDGEPQEFWLVGLPTEPGYKPNGAEIKVVASGDRNVSLIMPPDEFDIGVDIRLQYFERKLDPGTSQPSHYSSMVDILQKGSGKVLNSDVWITMNAPVDFTDPESGRSYRLFQESFQGPFHPWDDIYGARVSDPGKEELFRSVLTVNYDPGRGIKYAGCLFIVGGIATMFYMRAYFFTPAVQHAPSRAKSVDKREQHAQAS